MKRLVPFVFLTSCGYVGDVRPPALNIPQAMVDLRGLQRGSKLLLEATLPKITTEGMPIVKAGNVEVRIGPPPASGFDVNSWADSARKVDSASAEKGVLRADALVAEFAGKEVFVAARSAHEKGRWSPWSNVLALTIQPPLATPANIKPESTADGVRLSWTADAPGYRVYRKAEGQEEFRLLGESREPAYSDTSAEYGKPYAYQIQGTRRVGERDDDSEVSAVAEITPVDTFAPEVPRGLSALLGVSSVELAWERNLEKDLRGYYVYRAAGDGAFERLSPVLEAPAYGDRKIEAGKTYRYAVTSVDRNGNESARCEPVALTIRQ